jgi:hypothetical protein
MKTYPPYFGKLIMIVFVGSLAAIASVHAGAGSRADAGFNHNARLLVWRAADFGTIIYLTFYVDGVQVTTLGRNEGYEAIVRPGPHTFSVGTAPSPYGSTKLTHRRVNVRSGQTYAFTALWQWGDSAVLENSDPVNHGSRPVW